MPKIHVQLYGNLIVSRKFWQGLFSTPMSVLPSSEFTVSFKSIIFLDLFDTFHSVLAVISTWFLLHFNMNFHHEPKLNLPVIFFQMAGSQLVTDSLTMTFKNINYLEQSQSFFFKSNMTWERFQMSRLSKCCHLNVFQSGSLLYLTFPHLCFFNETVAPKLRLFTFHKHKRSRCPLREVIKEEWF